MGDLRRRFQTLDQVPVPDLWSDIAARTPSQATAVTRVRGQRSAAPARRLNASVMAILATGAILLLAVGGAFVGSRLSQIDSTPTPDTTATPAVVPATQLPPTASPAGGPAMTETFTSKYNGFSVRYPAGWWPESATAAWWPPFHEGRDTGVDFIAAPGAIPNGGFRAVSAEAPAGAPIDHWIDVNIFLPSDGTCDPRISTAWQEITIDGQAGRIRECPDTVEATVAIGRRVYVFNMFGPHGRAVFDAFAATIDLRPDDAVNPSPVPSAP